MAGTHSIGTYGQVTPAGDIILADTFRYDTAPAADAPFTDTLFISEVDTLPRAGTLVYTPATPEEVFGPSSFLAHGSGSFAAEPPGMSEITDNYAFGGAVLACFIGFCLVIYYFRSYVFGVFNIFRGPAYTEKALGEHSRVYDNFLGWTVALGTLVLGLTALKFAALLYGDPFTDSLPAWSINLLPLMAWAIAAAVFAFQFLVLKMAGSLTTYTAFTDSLIYLKKIIFSIGTIAVTPAFLLFALSHGQGAVMLGWIVAGVLAVAETLLIIRTFMLFLRQNFSILLWILYLCAIEIFPFSLIWIIAWKIL